MGKVSVMTKCYISWQEFFFFFECVVWIIQVLLILTHENFKQTKSYCSHLAGGEKINF